MSSTINISLDQSEYKNFYSEIFIKVFMNYLDNTDFESNQAEEAVLIAKEYAAIATLGRIESKKIG